MKKLIKILPILMTVMTVLMTVSPMLATTIGGVTVTPDTTAGQDASAIGDTILGIIQVVGIIISVGVLMVLGIKYMMGSAEEKAEYKKTMIPYLIGAVLLFAAVNLAKYVYNIASTVAA